MEKLNHDLQLPEYFVEAEIVKGTMQPREKLLADIRAVVDKAILDQTLTPAQILVAKINMIPDDAPAAEIEKQSQMLKELISTQPQSFTEYLGYDIFFEHQRNRPAIECFKRWLQRDPSDVSTRLNLGLAYDRVKMFAEADAAADYVLDNKLGLTEDGHAVAFQVKALAALGRRDFANTLGLTDKAFRADPYSSFMMSLWQLS